LIETDDRYSLPSPRTLYVTLVTLTTATGSRWGSDGLRDL